MNVFCIYIYIALIQISNFNVQKWQIFSENTHSKISFLNHKIEMI
jgi:hypothetical protein